MSIEERSKRIKDLYCEIDTLVEKYRYYDELVTKITPAYKDIHVKESNVDGSKIDTYGAEMADIQKIINDKLIEVDQLRVELERDINRIDDQEMKTVLLLRHLYHRPWGYIARRVKISESHIKNVFHKKCLEEFEKDSTKSTKSTLLT